MPKEKHICYKIKVTEHLQTNDRPNNAHLRSVYVYF